MTDTQTVTETDLASFTGSERFFRHPLSRNHIYTEGTQFLAERAGAYWLLDKIALHGSPAIDREDFQVWKLSVRQNRSAILTTEDGDEAVLKIEELTYTDFPLPEITLWSIRNELGGFTIMLPSEY
jgi:hypothetical protein